jgi:hypothetical protein
MHSWAAVSQELGGRSSKLCEGVADVAAGKPAIGREVLLRVIKDAPRSDAAYEAHEALLSFYGRTGQFRKAAREVRALLAIHPNEQDVLDTEPLFEALGRFPDMTVSDRTPVSFPASATNRTLVFPFTTNGQGGAFYLDTGANFSVISDAEARALDLTVVPVSSEMMAITGRTVPIYLTQMKELRIGSIRLRNVPFFVMPAAKPPFNGMPVRAQGLFGIQVAIAVQTVRLHSDGQLDLAFAGEPPADAPHLTFDGLMPVLHVAFQGKPIAFTFDTGAEHSTLNAVFARDFPDVVKLGAKKDYTDLGFGGAAQIRSIELPSWSIELDRKTATARAIPVLLEKTTDTSEWAAGNLGIDLLRQVEPFTIDFRNMQLMSRP